LKVILKGTLPLVTINIPVPNGFKSWKTTFTAFISAAASFVLFAQQSHYIDFPGWAISMAVFCQIGGLAAFGVVAKDSNVTGGTVAATPEAQVRVDEAPPPPATLK
jgi:hypothetical protein